MKPAKNNLSKLFMGGLCLVVGLLCLLPTPASAQLTVKERAMRNRNRPALWFLSKNKEKYMHYQPDTTKQEKPVKEKAPADYNIYRGNFNLLLFGNSYTRHWTYVPQADTHAETGGATFFTGLGVGFEYAYRDNRMVSLGWSVSGSVNAIGCGGSTGESSVVHQIDLLHSWNIKRLTLSVGPTVAWKRWSHWVDTHWNYRSWRHPYARPRNPCSVGRGLYLPPLVGRIEGEGSFPFYYQFLHGSGVWRPPCLGEAFPPQL